ncbi:MAG: ABC transporter permease subunit [Deltaproteobacteria bacterium]|nr:ABC transporter permease subunit [Candidatus Anaeroferrophillacea bacterium]
MRDPTAAPQYQGLLVRVWRWLAGLVFWSRVQGIARTLRGRMLVALVPTLWLLLFFLVPFLLVFKISLAESVLAQPPFTAIMHWSGEALLELRLNLANYLLLLEDTLYISAYLNSIRIAAISSVFTLLVGYPMALGIARARNTARLILLMLVILPFWTSFLIRVYAWIGILKNNGLLNNLLLTLGLIKQPLPMLHSDFAVFVGIVYSYLPFMVLPLYSTLVKIDQSLIEAAEDLGCRPLSAFWKVIFPLSLPGVTAGTMLVFIPAVGEFVIPDLLGGPDSLMIGKILWSEFFTNRDWPVASAIAVVMLLFLVVPMVIFQRSQEKALDEDGRGRR